MRLHLLVAKALLLVTLTGAMVAALVLAVPDVTDVGLIAVDKHRRLDAGGTAPRVIFIGGSNLMYGLDSPLVEHRTGQYTVNMGMNAEVGLAFMFEDISRKLRPGDTVVAVPEYVLFYQSYELGLDGNGPSLLWMIKSRPASTVSLTRTQQVREALAAVPQAARQKVLRLTEQGFRRLVGGAPEPDDPVVRYENRGGFNQWGDLVSHHGVTLATPLAYDGLGHPQTLDPEPFAYLQDMHDRLAAAGVRLIVLPPPVSQSYYDRERANIEMVGSEILRRFPDFRAAYVPSRYVFPDSCFFDSYFHMTYDCRDRRTEEVIQALGAIPPLSLAARR